MSFHGCRKQNKPKKQTKTKKTGVLYVWSRHLLAFLSFYARQMSSRTKFFSTPPLQMAFSRFIYLGYLQIQLPLVANLDFSQNMLPLIFKKKKKQKERTFKNIHLVIWNGQIILQPAEVLLSFWFFTIKALIKGIFLFLELTSWPEQGSNRLKKKPKNQTIPSV